MPRGIRVVTEGGIQSIYGPDGNLVSRHYDVGGQYVHEVAFGPHVTRGAMPSISDALAPAKFGGSEAIVASKDGLSMVVKPPSAELQPLSIPRQTGATKVPQKVMPIAGDSSAVYAFAHGIKLGQNTLMEGPPGVGKTQGVKYLAAKLGYNLVTIQVTPWLEEDAFIGTYRPVKQPDGSVQPEFVYSAVHEAVRLSAGDPSNGVPPKHTILLLDELNKLRSQGVYAALFGLLADGVIEGQNRTVGGKEELHCGAGFLHVVATQNPSKKSDPNGIYDNEDLDDALSDRFANKVTLDWPSPAEQVQIIGVHVQMSDKHRELALRVAKLAHTVRTTVSDGLPYPLGGRVLIAFMQDVVAGQSPLYAYEAKIANALPNIPSIRTAVRNYAIGEGVIDK